MTSLCGRSFRLEDSRIVFETSQTFGGPYLPRWAFPPRSGMAQLIFGALRYKSDVPGCTAGFEGVWVGNP